MDVIYCDCDFVYGLTVTVTKLLDSCSVVTVSLFSRSVGVSVKKSVVGLGFGVYTCVPSAMCGFHDI